ncbi:MAG: hypothetical protein WCX28_13475 [Bacteriovoracaceae bacterium]|nr:hypothetical protein [Bacteroidota bacterium]
MEQFFDLLLTNELYMLIAACLVIAIVFSIIKKIIKLLFYSFIALVAFIGYILYTGSTVREITDPIQQGVEKTKKSLQENKELQDAKKKIEKEIKK